ncbi:MAG: AMP-binding protein [Ruminococcus sp.]
MKKVIRDYLDYNYKELKKSQKTLADVFRLMFREKDYIIAETTENYRIRRYTYGEVEKMVNAAAVKLNKRIGATHGYVGLEMENSVEWIVSFWAILKSGNKPYLVNCRHPKELSNKIAKSLDIKYILSMKPAALDFEYISYSEIAPKKGDIEDIASVEGEFENELAIATSATSLQGTVCFYTGTEISEQLLNAKKIIESSKRMAAHYKGSLKQLAFLPFYHVFGLFAVYFWFVFFGRTVVFLKDYSPKTILETARRHEVTHIFAVPMLWHTIEKELLESVRKKGPKKEKKLRKGIKICTALQNIFPHLGVILSQKIMSEVTSELFGRSVRFMISGGSNLRDSALKLINGIGYPLHNGYGTSEVGITSVELRKKASERTENSIGRPFGSVEYKLDENSVLHVKGTSTCKKFLRNGEYIHIDGWYNTGDIMEQRDGNYYIKGRLSDLVIGDNGENINPDMLEQYFSIPFSKRFSVLGIDDALTLIVEVSKNITAESVESIKTYVKSVNNSLPLSSQIGKFYFTQDPIAAETAIKVSRQYLKRGIGDGSISLIPFDDIECEAPEILNEDMVKRLRKIISEVLSVDEKEIGINKHLVHDLGATSLQYFAVIVAIGEEFKVQNWSENDSYCYTIAEFCDYLERH